MSAAREPAAPPDTYVVGDEDEGSKGSRLRSFLEWGVIVLGAFLVAFVVKTFLLQAFYIPSASMEPALNVGDRVLVNKVSYDLHEVHRGDIVVFERPPREVSGEVKDLIKRVIGLPGETLEARNGRVFVDGEPLGESYLPNGTQTAQLQRQTVPAGHVFVLGDNRSDSRDSRFFGAIPESLIVGRAFVRVWPVDDLGGL